VKFLVDRCAGKRLADWLRQQGHDVMYSPTLGPDPGDLALLETAARENRILVSIDTDFGELIFREKISHTGMIRLPDLPAEERLLIVEALLKEHSQEMESGAIITVRGNRIRISHYFEKKQ
jgi:predicted nuclease of predicted toxin-antitoxin system